MQEDLPSAQYSLTKQPIANQKVQGYKYMRQ
jgi:hypothetical protein